jgi:two-component system sensor histidine kinase UhpB
VEDVTKRRRDEALLRQAHESLERRVAERTSELVAATQRARILAQRVYEVQEDERRRLAQDLHDEIGQALTLLKLNLQQAQQAKAGPFPSAQLEECLAVTDQLLAQVRNLALDLRPSLLDDLGLVPAVRWYVSRQAERAGWELQLALYDGPLALTPAQSIACFRVVQEAVTNIARHAGAKRVSVTVAVNDGQIEVAVHDDGVGFDVNHARGLAQQGCSMGLLGMEERISLVGGSLSIDSATQRGTRIAFTIPAGERHEPR